MTTVIDERVVEMRFNNEDFEKNVAQSMKTLDELKKALKFEGAGKSLEELGSAAKNFSLSGITNTISEATNKFSVMEVVGITAIAKITNSIMDMGTKLVKSLSVDQVSMGFQRYADKTAAVQTIMASTEKMFSSQAEQMRVVEEQMSKLAWFTDETSYNFNDMVSNIGKFTSNNIGLEESVTAMQGIANWAARSGQNAEAASRAMYNISQAMGVGAMKQMDWKSIENANMATAEFKQTAIDTAVELGRLRKVSEGLYETMDGKGTVSIETFREELKRGWFDKEVMSATFAKYGEFTNVLNQLYNATGKATSEILEDAEQFKQGNLDIEEYAKDTKMSVEELTAAFEELNAEGNELGKKAFGNAQEAKTFMEAIEATKDAVSTKWSETFEIIFGNYLEAKKLWTGLANDLWAAFAAGGDERNEMLRAWKELGGRKELIMGVVDAANLLVKPLSTIKLALKDMFPDAESMGEVLYNLTVRFRELMDRLQPSNEMLANLYRTFKGLFTLGKMLGQVVFSLVKAILPAARPFGTLLEMILTFTGYVGVFIEVISEYADEVGLFQVITEGVIAVFGKLLQGIKTVATFVGGALLLVATAVATVFGKIITVIAGFLGKTQIIQKAIGGLTKVIDKFKKIFSKAEKPIEKVNTVVVEAEKYFGAAAKSGAEFGTVMKDTGDKSQKALTPLQRVGNVIKLVVSALGLAAVTIIKLIGNLWTKIKEFFANLKERFNDADEDKNVFVIVFEELFNKIKEILGDAKDAIKEFFDNLGINTDGIKEAFDTITTALKTFLGEMDGGKIVAILLSIALLAVIGQAIDLADKISTLTGTLNTFFKSVNKLLTKQFGSKLTVLKDIALAFTMIAGSLALLMYVDKDGTKIVKFASTMGILVGVLTMLAFGIEKLSQKFLNVDLLAKGFAGVSASLLALSSSILIIAGAMAILANIKGEDLGSLAIKLGIAAAGLAAIAGIAIALSKWTGPMAAGVATIIALGIALMQVAKAMKELSTVPIDDINARWPEYIAMFGGLSAMLAASSLLSIRSAVGLILTAKGLEMIFPQISNMVELAKQLPVKAIVDAALENIQVASMFLIGATLAVIAAALLFEKRKSLIDKVRGGSLFSGIGGTIAGIGVGVFLIVSSIKKIQDVMKNLQPGELTEIGITMGIIIAALGAIGALIIAVNQLSKYKFPTDASTSFVKMGMMFVGLGVAIRLMASAVKAIAESTANGFELAGATAIIVVLGAMLAGVIWVAGDVPKAIPAMAALITATIAMGVLIGELAVLTLLVDGFKENWKTLLASVVIMGGIFTGMIFLMKAMSKLSGVKAGVIWGLAATIAAIGAVLVALTVVSATNPIGLATAIGGLIGVLGTLAFVFTVLGEMDPPSIKKLLSIVAIIATIGTIGASLAIVAQNDWPSILAAGAMISAALAVIGGMLIILDKIGSQGGQLGAAGAIAIIGFACMEIAASIKILDGLDWSVFGMFAAAMGTVVGILAILAAISAVFPPFGAALLAVAASLTLSSVGLLIGSVAFGIFAAALPILADGLSQLIPVLIEFATVPFAEIGTGLSQLAGGLFALGAAGIIVGIGAIGLGVLAVAIWALGAAAGASVDNLNALAAVDLPGIAKGLFELGVAGAVIGAVSPLLLAGAVAVALFGGSLILLKAGFDAIEGCFDWFSSSMEEFSNSISNTLDGVKETFRNFFPDLGALFTGADASNVINEGNIFGKLLAGEKGGGGILGGFSIPLGYMSPPQFILDFFSACSTALGMNGEAVSAATQSGGEIGDAFGSSFFDKASAWFANLGANISSWWSGVTASFSGGSSQMVNDLGTAGAAAEKFGNKTQKTGNVLTNAWEGVKNTFGGLTDRVTKGLDETKDKVGKFIDDNNYLSDVMEDVTKQAEEATKGLTGVGDAAAGAGGKAKGAAEDMKDLRSSLVDTLSNQLDMFSKFEIKMGVSGEQMIENMRSNIDGFASWSHRMTVLAERFAEHGISDTLYKKLAELGPKGYETMNAFYEMTDEQLEEVRGLWETGLTLPEGQADIVASGFQYMGEMSTQGFSNALDEHKAAHAAAQFGKAALKGIADALGIASPSKETFKQGVYVTEGLGMGMTSASALTFIDISVKRVADYVMQLFNETLSEDVLASSGEGILTNLFNGILGESVEENPIMLAFIETFTNFDAVDEALTLFVEHLKEFLFELFEIEGDEAPSLFFQRLVETSILKTIIDAITLKGEEVITAIETLCKNIILKICEVWEMEAGDGGFGRSEVFYQMGLMAMQGLLDGIEEKGAECIQRAKDIADECKRTMDEAFDNGSPSKVMRQMGIFVMEGLAIGFEDTAERVYSAARNVAEGTIDVMSDVGRIQDVINTDMDFNPVITPMLDLSTIRSQVSELDKLMNDPEYGIGQNEGDSSKVKNPSQISFTQNNYSPKSLSRYEIYRQTRNQLSQLKGALG